MIISSTPSIDDGEGKCEGKLSPQNGRKGRLREIMLQASLDNRLVSCLIELTRNCNYACAHCFNDQPLQDNSREMDTSTVEDTLNQLAALGSLFLVFSGGEPLLRPDFLRLVSYARRLGFFLEIFTNGSLIDEEMAKRLAAQGVGGVNISLYAGRDHDHVHDGITGFIGSHRLALRAMDNLVRAGVSVRANIIVMKANQDCWRGAVAAADEMGVDFRVDHTILPSRSSGYASCSEVAVDMETMVDAAGSAGINDSPATGVDDLEKLLGKMGISHGQLPLCGAGRSSIHIHADGTVWPCSIYPWQAGDLKEESLRSIWMSSPVLCQLRSQNRGVMDDCRECQYKFMCSTCPAMSAVEYGDPCRAATAVCVRTKARVAAMSSSANR